MHVFSGLWFVFAHPMNKGTFWQTALRVLWWKFNQHFFHLPVIVELTPKIRCICFPHLSYSGLIMYTTWPDYHEWHFLLELLTPDAIFVDVGAHAGDYSLLAADVITSGHIYAFEPHPKLLPLLAQNCALNSLEQRLTIIPKAVADTIGTLTLVLTSETETSHLAQEHEHHTETVSVPTITLDSFAQEHHLSHISVLKVDVEGAEGLVFRGAQRLLAEQHIDVILFELNQENTAYGTTGATVLEMLRHYHYQLFTLSQESRLTPLPETYTATSTVNLVAISEKAKEKINILKTSRKE